MHEQRFNDAFPRAFSKLGRRVEYLPEHGLEPSLRALNENWGSFQYKVCETGAYYRIMQQVQVTYHKREILSDIFFRFRYTVKKVCIEFYIKIY